MTFELKMTFKLKMTFLALILATSQRDRAYEPQLHCLNVNIDNQRGRSWCHGVENIMLYVSLYAHASHVR